MKKLIKIMSLLFIATLAFIIAGCDNVTIHKHTFTEWDITVEPTFEIEGKAVRTCECGNISEEILPVLADEKVWTKAAEKEATCTELPTETYSSVYGNVEIVIGELLPHNYDEWYISVAPTVDEKGVYKHVCKNCEHFEETEIPALSDEDVWTKVESVESECDVEGYDLYESEYGQVKVSFAKLPHEFGEWEIVDEPTLEEQGSVVRVCPDCGHTETEVLEALNNKEFWKEVEKVDATYNEAGYAKFACEYVEFTQVLDKLVAPYDGKTYSSFAIQAEKDGVQINGVISIEDVWSNANVTLDNNGTGMGTAFPFRGLNVFEVVDPKTGKITITQTDYDTDEETGELILNPEEVTVYNGYVDFETGLIVRAHFSAFNYIHVLTPFEIGIDRANAAASSWDNAIAVEYTYEGTTYKMFAYKDMVYFGVEFKDQNGNVVPTKECYNSEYLYVYDKNDELIEGFVFNGEKLVVADGFEGTYVNEENTLVVSGYGVATLNGIAATYEFANDTIYTLGIYVENTYYEVTLDKDTYQINKPMVNVSFDAGSYATVEAQVYNKNIVVELPQPTCDTQTFKGWFYDAECTKPVETEFKPLTDVVLYAAWKAKVIINLVNVLEGDAETLYLGVGDVIGEYLPTYNLVDNKIFKGWYLDAEFTISLPEEVEVTEEDSNISIYAKWEEIPAYYGTYKGTELYNAGFGNYGGKTLKIDENGNISGLKTGTVLSYDKETQKVTWKTSSGYTYSFYYNEKLGIIAGIYNNNEISNDFYILSKADQDGKANAFYGVKAAKTPGSSDRGWYAHFVNITTDLGDVELFIYNNYIYDTFTATDALGNPVTAANVKNAKAVIVKDAEGNIIVSVASKGASFDENKDTVDLDPYYGTYSFGEESVVLDGSGTIVYGEKTGTYTLAAEGSDYQFDVYLENNSEYYELTLNGDACTLTKAMVEITFEEGEYANIDDVTVNKNVAYTLPTLEADTHIFNGWFLDAECTQEAGTTLVPKTDTVLYALWKVKVVLTINSNNGEEQATVSYSTGDTATVLNPVKDGYALEGWYTTETFEENSKWAVDSDVKLGSVSAVINESVEIYAKWVEAPIYSGHYTSVEFDGTNLTSTSGTYTRNSSFTIDPYGNGEKGISWPFAGGAITVEVYNEETGYIEFKVGSSDIYSGYFDATTKFVVLSDQKGSNKPLTEIMVLNPIDEKNTYEMWSHSYWTNGKNRAISYLSETLNYNIYISNDVVYFGVKYTNGEGTELVGKQCYNSPILYVHDAENNLIAKFAYDGTSLQQMDGNEGTYTQETNTLVVDGVKTVTLNGAAGTYTVAEEGSAYSLDVYVENAYYEVTLDKANGTYTINRPMVTISFDAGDKATVEAQELNKNIQVTLPIPTNDAYIFRGWYKEATLETLVNNEYIPTETETLYAKWDAKVALTVVYGNTLNDAVLYYGIGDTVAPVVPTFTNGKIFNGWYLDAEFTQAYELGAIIENTTIYCNWMEAVTMYGSYVGFNVFGGGSKKITYIGTKFEVSADGTASGNKKGTIEDYNAETGTFVIASSGKTYGGLYDEASGTIAYAYSSGTSLGTDFYLLFKKKATSGEVSANLDGFVKLITINFEDGTSENYLYINNVIYSGVTWTTDGTHTAYTIADASTYTICDRNGNVLLTK